MQSKTNAVVLKSSVKMAFLLYYIAIIKIIFTSKKLPLLDQVENQQIIVRGSSFSTKHKRYKLLVYY